jgi:hypothetical protein
LLGGKKTEGGEEDGDDDEEEEEEKGAAKGKGGKIGTHVKRSDGMEMEVTFVSGEAI